MNKPTKQPATTQSRRNKTFDATHQLLIEAAVKLISEKGVEALSLAELARAVAMNRATIYYHFSGREALLEAVSTWSSQQLTRGFAGPESQEKRIEFVPRFVLDNPDLIKLWIEQFIAPGDIRDRYPQWDEFVAGSQATFSSKTAENLGIDIEVYCTIMLTGAIIGPLVFRQSVRPDLDEETIIERFRAEHQRVLRKDGLLRIDP